MPKRLSPEEATTMIIRRRMRQMEEARMTKLEGETIASAANDDDIGVDAVESSGKSGPSGSQLRGR